MSTGERSGLNMFRENEAMPKRERERERERPHAQHVTATYSEMWWDLRGGEILQGDNLLLSNCLKAF